MSRARHKKHAAGGKVSWAGGNQNVIKEAHERKHGGRVHHEGEGEEAKEHAGKRSRGGKMRKHGGKVEHEHKEHEHKEHEHKEHEHKKRARGGAIGSDKRPLSSAASVKFLPDEKGGQKGAGPASEMDEKGGED